MQQPELNSPVAYITVLCYDLHGSGEPHRAFIYPDGHVRTPDHEEAPWGLDQDILHALGGEEDISPCRLWRKAGERTQPRTRGYATNPKAGYSSLYSIAWWNGKHEFYFNDDIIVVATLDWELTEIGPWTVEAEKTVLSGYGIRTNLDDRNQRTPTSTLLTPDFTPVQAVRYLRLIIPHTETNVRVEHYELKHLWEKFPDETELKTWLTEGIPWDTCADYRTLGIPLPLAVNYAQEAYQRGENSIMANYPDTFTNAFAGGVQRVPHLPEAYTQRTTGPEWAQQLTQIGIQSDRIIPFMRRTRKNGKLQWREKTYQHIVTALENESNIIPATWIIEAVAALPDNTTLIAYSHLLEPERTITKEWIDRWIQDDVTPSIIRYLQQEKDPADWVPGWEYPTVYELSQKQTFTEDTHTS